MRVLPVCPHPHELPHLLATSPVGGIADATARIESPLEFTGGRRLPLRPRLLQKWQHHVSRFHGLRRALRNWERMARTPVDLVFFACIYESHFELFRTACPHFGYDWAGLHLHARRPSAPAGDGGSFDPLRSPRLQSLGVLDPNLVEPYRSRTGGKPVFVFPDLTDPEHPAAHEPEAGLANKLRALAGGRKVVALLGHLKLSKGLEAFTRAAADPRLQDVIFFLGGEIDWDGVPRHLRSELMTAWERSPNILTHLQRIEEKAFNGVLRMADVVYAAYVDFPFSSNVLTKAAIFQRPIVVTEGQLMGERVREFGLGAVVPDRNPQAVADAILELLSSAGTPSGMSARYKAYAELHSYQRLKEVLGQVLRVRNSPASPLCT